MSPANIEQAIKGGQPLISQVLVVGDRRPYNVALIILDRDGVAGFARDHELAETALEKLTGHPDVLGAVAAAVGAGNQRLSRPEQIRRYQVLDHDWPLGGEQLTHRQGQTRRGCPAVPGGHRRLVRMTANPGVLPPAEIRYHGAQVP